ncbi:hypothetical protein EDD21DRAFT_355752 [Dissophora ornata]|nr:hypothetical protein EDD21DRAFT_355752 [Dissophora ornata]
MNVLVNYASDSESDIEQEPLAPQQNAESKNKGDDDESILAALKDLQDFAASVDTPTTSNNATGTTQQLITSATAAVAGPSQDDDLGFLSFMKEIDAIPFPPQEQEQEQALPPPPPPPPPLTSLDVVPPPPPTPPPMVPSEIQQSEADYETLASRIAQEVQMVHNRLYHLSLLPSTSIDQKDLERRLLEFAIRIADWQRGGLYEPYFLGMERAEVISTCQRTAGTAVEDMTELPPFGGIVGPMVKHMYELEHMAAPPGWIAIWDQADEAYGFQHTSTGTYSPVYPSQELIHHLDPPSYSSGSPVLSRSGRTSYFTSRSTAYSTDRQSPLASVAQSSWNQATISSPHSATESTSHTSALIQPSDGISKSTSATKTKKRKLSESNTAINRNTLDRPAEDDHAFNDQHIHPSRRAVLTSRSAALALPSASSSGSSSSSKTMPKKLASLLQKWSEKDREESGEDDDEEEDDRDSEQQYLQSGGLDAYSAPTGSNSQSLGGDWRDRRLHPR